MQNTKQRQNIPKGWQRTKLGDISNITNGKTNTQDAVVDGEFPLFDRSVAIKRSNKYLFDDTVVILPGEGAEFIPRYYSGKFDLHQRAYAIFPKENTDPSFLFQYLYAKRGDFVQKSVGSTVKSLRLPIIQSIDVFLPPLPEQKKIAEILEAVDEEIQKTDEIISATEKLKNGLMQQLFTRGIGHTKFKKTAVGEMPAEWQIIKLGEVAMITRGGSPRPIESFITSDDNGLNWLKIGDIELGAKYIQHTSQKIKKSGLSKTTIVHVGDFILSNSMSFGRPYILKIDACIHDGWLAFKDIKTNLISSDFLYYLLSSKGLQDNFLAIAAGSGVKNLKKESVSNVTVALPSINEQKKISEILSAVGEKISINQKQKEKLTLLKKGLMQDLLSGRKRTI